MENNNLKSRHYPTATESLGIALIFIFLSMILGTGGILLQDTLDPAYKDVITLLVYSLSALGTIIIALAIKKNHEPGIKKGFKIKPVPFIVIPFSVVMTLAVIIAMEPLTNWIPIPEFFKEVMEELYKKSLPVFLTAVIAAPVLEELIFRGIILEGLLKNYNPVKAILITNILFGAVHLNPWQFVGALIMGVFISWIYMRTRNILLSILIHFVNNLVGYLAIYFAKGSPMDMTLKDLLGSSSLYFILIGISILILTTGILYHKRFLPQRDSGQ